jgi:hypothetical protein
MAQDLLLRNRPKIFVDDSNVLIELINAHNAQGLTSLLRIHSLFVCQRLLGARSLYKNQNVVHPNFDSNALARADMSTRVFNTEKVEKMKQF